jgi:hypothetical protein
MTGTKDPRPLTERETAVLAFLLSIDDLRVAPLRDQAATAVVTGMCTCGCATIDLAVDRTTGHRAERRSPAIEAFTIGMLDQKSDPTRSYELLVFLDDGWLSSLEIVYYGAESPREFPDPGTFDAPEIISALHDDQTRPYEDWFMQRGFQLDIGRWNRTYVAHLRRSDGAIVAPRYGSGDSPTAAAARAQARYLEEQ